MTIHLSHRNISFPATVTYAGNHIKNCILVRLGSEIPGFGSDIFLLYNGKNWHDEFGAENRLPDVFEQILQRLKNVMKLVQHDY